MAKVYELRFWQDNINIMVGGRYSHCYDSWRDAWDAANAFLKYAYEHGATEIDINNEFYPILDD